MSACIVSVCGVEIKAIFRFPFIDQYNNKTHETIASFVQNGGK